MTTNDEINEMLKDTWTIARTDGDGVTTTRTFHSENWPFALQQFVSFLKQDFGVDDSSVAINGSKHALAGENPLESGWYGEFFYPESVEESGKEKFYSPESYPVIDEDDGWIPWDRYESPVTEGTPVAVRFANGQENLDCHYHPWGWGYDKSYKPTGYEIVAYKVVKE